MPKNPPQPPGQQAEARRLDLPSMCVLGLGLIGGSLMRAAAPHTDVYGWSPSQETRAAASRDGFAAWDTLQAALRRAAAEDSLVVLAAPVSAFVELLRHVEHLAPGIRLTDVAGVKALVASQVTTNAPRARYVGSHPMAGTQHSGWEAGSADLFQQAAWVTCLTEETELTDWLPVARLALAVGSHVVPCEPAEHDRAVARVSHLPHLLALALAQVGQQGGPLALSLAASSFADGTRVAGTRPALIRAFTETNAGALTDALDDALALIGVARASLASTGSLLKITEGGHTARAAFLSRAAGLRPVKLYGDELIEQLLAVGSAGGHITGIEETEDGLVVQAVHPMLEEEP